jgi:hypothetical protein
MDIPKVARVEKYSRDERKEYKLKQQAGKVRDPHKKIKAPAKNSGGGCKPACCGCKEGIVP